MARLSTASSRHVSIVSMPGSSSPEADTTHHQDQDTNGGRDEESVPANTLLGGIKNAAAGLAPIQISEADEDEDGPSSQLHREASIGRSPAVGRLIKRTDEESAAILNSAISFANSPYRRGPEPLPNKRERAARRSLESRESSAHRHSGPARPDVYDLITDSPPASTRSRSQTNGGEEKVSRQRPRRRGKARLSEGELAEEQAETAPVTEAETVEEAPKRKRGRPPKELQNSRAPAPKKQKSGTANTGRRRSSRLDGRMVSSQESASQLGESTSSAKLKSIRAGKSSSRLSQSGPSRGSAAEPPARTQRVSAGPSGPLSAGSSNENVDLEDEESDTRDAVTPDEAVASGSLDGKGNVKDERTMLGLQTMLNDIWMDPRGVKMVRRKRKDNRSDGAKNESSKKVIQSCDAYIKELKDLMGNSSELIDSEVKSVTAALVSLELGVTEFDLENKDEIKNYIFQDLYAFVIPTLLRTLCNVMDFQVQFLCGEDGKTSLSTRYLEKAVGFVTAMIQLADRARSSNIKVPSSLQIVKPTRNYIIAPLRKFETKFSAFLKRQVEEEAQKQAMRIEADRLERSRIRRQRQAEQEAQRRARDEDWRLLHIDRRDVEPYNQPCTHLDWVPPPQAEGPKITRDIDANGDPFDRVELFEHSRSNDGSKRNGAATVQEIIGSDWTDKECLALMEGLAEYASRDYENPRYQVYRKIIRKYCRPGRTLCRFNVMEIIQKAKYLKRMLEDTEWARRIPTF